MQEIQRMTSRQRQERQTAVYRALISIAEEVVESARRVLQNTSEAGKDVFAELAVAGLREEIEHYCGLGTRVINQARR
jgi:IS5 family transposase